MSGEFSIEFKVSYHGAVPSELGLSQRKFNDIKRNAWYHVGKYWMAHFRRKHFTHAGAREYGYLPRKGQAGNTHPKGFWASYCGQKQKQKGHTLPLVWSGESREKSKAARIHATATAKKSRCRIVLNVPTLNYKNPHSQIDMRAEMTRISEREMQILAKEYEKHIDMQLQMFGGLQTIRIAA